MRKWYINEGPDSDVVLSSRVRLARNFKKYPFPHKSTPEQQKQIIEDTKDALYKGNQQMTEKFEFYNFGTLNNIEKSVFVEKHVASKELLEGKRERGILLSSDERISIMINEEDHLRIQCLATGMQLNEALEVCNNIDDLLSEFIEFSWDENIGYLTSCPTNIGTAIRASVMMHLPALVMTGYIKTVIEALGKLGLAVRGMYGEHTEASGNMFQLSNQITLGKSEEDILLSIKNIATQIIEQERALRQQLLRQNKYQLEDRIFRSFGILKNSRIIATNECLKHLSDLRMGVDLGIIEGISIEDINEIMLLVQPGSLQEKAKKRLNVNERSIVRAKIVRDMMNK
ncbi:MAG TPA: protein arginine kinase [Thermoclostridium sp.]|nr:protein arginine kinase [Thermoclostridium sp.]